MIALSCPPTEAEEAQLRRILIDEDPERMILTVMPVTDVFERADPVHIAKKVGVCVCVCECVCVYVCVCVSRLIRPYLP